MRMRLSSTRILLIVSVLSVFKSVDSIICYQCNSQRDANCDDLEQNSTSLYLKECTDDEPVNFEGAAAEAALMMGLSVTSNTTNEDLDIRQLNSSKTNPMNVSRNFTMCRKIETTIYGVQMVNTGDQEKTLRLRKPRIIRQCGYITDEAFDEKCYSDRSPSVYQITCSCNTNECNTAAMLYRHFSVAKLICMLIISTVVHY